MNNKQILTYLSTKLINTQYTSWSDKAQLLHKNKYRKLVKY